MITPTFFAQDNFKSYADGNLNAPSDGVVWAFPGMCTLLLLTWAHDNFISYVDGNLDAPDGGSDWAGSGVTTYYLNT